jgi:hypothetical protein
VKAVDGSKILIGTKGGEIKHYREVDGKRRLPNVKAVDGSSPARHLAAMAWSSFARKKMYRGRMAAK